MLQKKEVTKSGSGIQESGPLKAVEQGEGDESFD